MKSSQKPKATKVTPVHAVNAARKQSMSRHSISQTQDVPKEEPEMVQPGAPTNLEEELQLKGLHLG